MDTQEWGPPGWKLIHSIAYQYELDCLRQEKEYEKEYEKECRQREKNIKIFFKSMRHLLPCIYCRRSYKIYIKELPLFSSKEKTERKFSLFKWTYDLHNKVNNKLKKQGYNHYENPLYKDVLKKYKDYFSKNKNCTEMGWKFLYSIIFNYDEGISITRKKAHVVFFYMLGKVLPNKLSRDKYNEHIRKYPIEKYMSSTKELKKWIYLLEKRFKNKCCSYQHRCKSIEKYKVDKCSGHTCRL